VNCTAAGMTAAFPIDTARHSPAPPARQDFRRAAVRRARQLGWLGAAVLALGSSTAAAAPDMVRFQLSWRPQAEHGCYYQAVAAGIYARHNLDVSVEAGGPQINTQQILISGRVDFAMGSNSFTALNYVRENIPMLVVGTIFQRDPQTLIAHVGVRHDTLESLRGAPIYVGNVAKPTWWNFLRVKFGYTDDMIRSYTYTFAPFLADKNAAQQGFVTNEPYQLALAGVKVNTFLLADHGYDDYAYTIETSRALVERNPELVQRFVNATIEGCYSYLNGDPAPGNRLIIAANPQMTPEIIANSIAVMRARHLIDGEEAATYGIGVMTDARWKSFFEVLVQAGLYTPDLDYKRGYTLQFVGKRHGM
jgi:NitT/TauT family transport system substrate-binding protein